MRSSGQPVPDLFLATGEKTFLKTASFRTVNSLKRAEKDAYLPKTGLFGGCSSFVESNSAYPKKYNYGGPLIAKTSALSTNALYYHGYVVAAKMARALGNDPAPFEKKAEALKQAINAHFWQEDKGYYAYIVEADGKLIPNMEGLGEALCILYGIADSERAARILKSTPTTALGFPCLWPQFPEHASYDVPVEYEYYHDGMIWPFVQGYWGWAAAKSGDVTVLGQELEKLLKLSERNETFMEFYRPQDGKPDGSKNQLWSASGYLGLIYHGLFGIHLNEKGIHFSPVMPARFERLSLDRFIYRKALLSITVTGHGTKIQSFKINGEKQAEPLLKAAASGIQKIKIVMGN